MHDNYTAHWGLRLAAACHICLWACISLDAQELPRFREHVLSRELKFGYQLVAADLNGDGKKDVIAVDEAATELAWYENQHPAWNRHVLAVNVPRPLNADCWDVDGDGIPEVVLAYRVEPTQLVEHRNPQLRGVCWQFVRRCVHQRAPALATSRSSERTRQVPPDVLPIRIARNRPEQRTSAL